MPSAVVLVGGSRLTKGLAHVIDAADLVVRMKDAKKLRPEDVGSKTDYIAFKHYRHWLQKKVKATGLMWAATAHGPLSGDGVLLMPERERQSIEATMRDMGIIEPSLGLCALLMTLHFLKPKVVLCAACDSFFDDVDLPGHKMRIEREMIASLPVERIQQ